jgi:hypothetical protein
MLLFFMILISLPTHPGEPHFVDITEQERENILNIVNQDIPQNSQDDEDILYTLYINVPECDEGDGKVYWFGECITFCEISMDKVRIDKLWSQSSN